MRLMENSRPNSFDSGVASGTAALLRCHDWSACPIGAPDAWPHAFLRLAWGKLIENSAHDSICGCSIISWSVTGRRCRWRRVAGCDSLLSRKHDRAAA